MGTVRDALASRLIDTITGPPDWQARALCAGEDPELWWAQAGSEDDRRARAICRRCPVRQQCLDRALELGADAAEGVWGGLDGDQRRHVRRDRPAPPAAARVDVLRAVRQLAAGGRTDASIAATLGMSREAVYYLRRRHDVPAGRSEYRSPWTGEETATLRRLAADGTPDPEIAATLHRSREAVRQRRNELGIRSGRAPGRPGPAAATGADRAKAAPDPGRTPACTP